MKIKFEIKKNNDKNVIYINDELFDWEIDEEELDDALKFANEDQEVKKAIHADIQNFFLSCLKEVTNQEITLKQLNDALDSGYLETNDSN